MAKYSLNAAKREITGKKISKLRDQNMIPGVLYGPEAKNQNITIKKNDFNKVYQQAGSSHLIDLKLGDGKEVPVLVQDIQKNPLNNDIIHFDLYQVQEGKKMTAIKELDFVGTAPAVKEFGGILIKYYDQVEIECLPKDLELVDKIKVDLSVLETFNDMIYIKDLEVPPEIKIMEEPEDSIAAVSEPKEEKIEEPTPVEGEEGAEGEEGEAPKEGEETQEGEDQSEEGKAEENK